MRMRMLSIMLILCIMVTLFPVQVLAVDENLSSEAEIWDGTIAENYAGGNGTQTDPYLIKTADQLARISQQVNNGIESYKYYKLCNNIYLNDISTVDLWSIVAPENEWTPIGSYSVPFRGNFNGDGHIIYGLYISTDADYQGLFGAAEGDQTIENLGVESSYIKGNDYIGSICGYRYGGGLLGTNEMRKCHSNTTVIGKKFIGGILGYYAGDMIVYRLTNCYNTGNINGEQCVGGLVGGNMSISISNCYNVGNINGTNQVGGIAGKALSANLCWNTGEISGTNQVGGILGEAFYYGSTSSSITKCFNAGDITGGSYVGGLLGYSTVYSGYYPSTISDCYNTGKVSGTDDYVGGIAGQGWLCKYINCYNTGNCTLEMGTNLGAIFNYGARNESRNLYYLEECCGEGYENIYQDRVIEVNNTQLCGSDMVNNLNNGSSVWSQDVNGYNSGYPILNGIDYEYYSSINNPSIVSGNTIVEAVRQYTSLEQIEKLEEILNANYGSEELMQRLLELFSIDNITDIQEGIDYILDTKSQRMSYRALLSDDMYCAYNYHQYVQTNLEVKSTLLMSSLIFGGEINDWLSFDTYIQSDYPGVSKYKKMLLDFMGHSQESIQYVNAVKSIEELFKNTTSIVSNTALAEIQKCSTYDELIQFYSSTKFYDLIVEYCEYNTGVDGELLVNFKLSEDSGIGKFAKDVKDIDTAFKIEDLAVSSIVDLIMLDSTLALYEEYKVFLSDITTSTELPFEMRWAAYQILQDLKTGYFGEFTKIGLDVLDMFLEVTDFTGDMMTSIYDRLDITSFQQWLSAVNITVWFINQAADIEAIMNASAITEAYAILSSYYKNKLQKSAEVFISKDSSGVYTDEQLEESAWEFYYDYTMLWNLRKAGEEAYLDMCNMKGLLSFLAKNQYMEKSACVNETLEILDRSKFIQIVPAYTTDNHYYNAKNIIECPVNVEIYDSNDRLLVTLEDGIERDIQNEYGRFISTYRAFDDDYVKILYWNKSSNITVKLVAQNDGLVSFTRIDNKSDQTLSGFYNIAIKEGETITIKDPSSVAVKTDVNGAVLEDISYVEINANNSESTKRVQEIIIPTLVSLSLGDIYLFEMKTLPVDASFQGMEWFSKNSSIVSVKNGVMKAVGVGSTEIICASKDGGASATCIVKVIDSNSALYYNVVFDANVGGNYTETQSVPENYSFLLPECGFVHPEGKKFKAWSINGTEYQPGTYYIVKNDTIIKALWTEPVIGIGLDQRVVKLTDIGEIHQLTEIIMPINATNKHVTWTSSNPSVATVTNAGLVTAISEGVTTITATTQDGGYTATCEVTVELPESPNIPVTGVQLNTSRVALNRIGDIYQIEADVTPLNATNQAITWTSSNPGVATVTDTGLVTAVSNGVTTITATTQDGGYTATCEVTVELPKNPNIPVIGVELNTSRIELYRAGNIYQLIADVLPIDATNQVVTWASSNPWVATVSNNGLVTAVSEGTAIITVTTEDGKKVAKCTVTVWIDSGSGGTGGGGNSSSTAPTSYTITSEDTVGGAITIIPKTASRGQTVTITAVPDDGFTIKTLSVTDKNGNKIELTKKTETSYTFKMPASKVTVSAIFTEIVVEPEPVVLPFEDISQSAWYYGAVEYVYSNDMMQGTSATTFSPEVEMSRGMIATVLYRLANTPTLTGSTPFSDVGGNEWYTDAIQWAAENNIMSGYGNNRFGPMDSVTREQLAVILYNYTASEGISVEAAGDLSVFHDTEDTSDWAEKAISWAVGVGLLSGKGNGILDPTGTATRAEVAQMLMNYCTKVA